MNMKEEDIMKARAHFRWEVNKVLKVFDLYGLGVHITPVTGAIEDLAVQLSEHLKGNNEKPIHITWRYTVDGRYNPDD